jgi:5-amino-6-(5-phosphoribosylamino)uracil reductase
LSAPSPAATARPELRLVLAISLDGRLALPQGGAAQIGGRGDRRVLEEALAWADGCLVGGQTLRCHGSTCLIHAPDLLEQRHRQGRCAQPVAVAVSRGGGLDPALAFFRQPLRRWLLLAAPSPPDESPTTSPFPQPPLGFERCLPLPGWPEALASLAAAGLGRLVVLGGAALAGSLLAQDQLDELQLTLCPRLLGGEQHWLPAGVRMPTDDSQGWQLLESRPLEGEDLLLRYRRRRTGSQDLSLASP